MHKVPDHLKSSVGLVLSVGDLSSWRTRATASPARTGGRTSANPSCAADWLEDEGDR